TSGACILYQQLWQMPGCPPIHIHMNQVGCSYSLLLRARIIVHTCIGDGQNMQLNMVKSRKLEEVVYSLRGSVCEGARFSTPGYLCKMSVSPLPQSILIPRRSFPTPIKTPAMLIFLPYLKIKIQSM